MSERPSSRIKGAARTAAGVALVATGTALLVLPGPGLALIAAGITVMPDGRRKLDRIRRIVEPHARKIASAFARRASESAR